MTKLIEGLKEMGFEIKECKSTSIFDPDRTYYDATAYTEGNCRIGLYFGYSMDGEISVRVDKFNGSYKWYYGKTVKQIFAIVRQCLGCRTIIKKEEEIKEEEIKEEETMTTVTKTNMKHMTKMVEKLNDMNKEEDTTMKTTVTINLTEGTAKFTLLNGTTYKYNIATKRYAKTTADGKTIRISKAEYEQAKHECDLEQEVENLELHPMDEQAELDKDPCRVEVNTDLYKPAVFRKDCPGCVDCRDCNVTGCVHRDCMRRNPRSEGGNGECPRLDVKPQQEEEEAKDPELDQIMEETGLEASDAELERNIRNEQKKPVRKPRKSKDIAYEGHGKTLTAKQVDFILHLSDTCFWEHGLESAPWIDVLCDEIGGQFAGKPMTVGAMVSTLCEKGLAERATDSLTDMVTGRSRKATYFALTELGKEIAAELGLK